MLDSGVRNFSHLVQKRNIFEFGVEWTRVEKNVRFRRKTGHISETVRGTAKVTIMITNKK